MSHNESRREQPYELSETNTQRRLNESYYADDGSEIITTKFETSKKPSNIFINLVKTES